MTSTLQRNQVGFNALMSGRSDTQRTYVMDKLEAMGTTVADPWYLQLANITLLGVILEHVPHEYRQTVQEAQRQFFEQLHQEIDSLETVKSSSVEVKVASAVDRLLAERLGGSVSDASVNVVASKGQTAVSSTSLSVHLRLMFLMPVVIVLAMGVGSVLTSLFLPTSYMHAGQ
ncbi:MAG: DUF6753 family protein [Cyanobacteria bacterium P01_F01_bin.150]